MCRLIFTVFLAIALVTAGCARLEDAELPGPAPDPAYGSVLADADALVKGWRYFEQHLSRETPPVPFVAFRENRFTVSLSCFGSDGQRRVRAGVAERDLFHQNKTIAIRYRFDDENERRERWRWHQDAAAQSGADAVAFARGLARWNVLRIHLQGGSPQTVSLRGSAQPIKRFLAACGHPPR